MPTHTFTHLSPCSEGLFSPHGVRELTQGATFGPTVGELGGWRGWRGVGGGLEGINLKTLESSEGKLAPFVGSIAQKKKSKANFAVWQ